MLYLNRSHVEEMLAHARADNPNECCGILVGTDGHVQQVRRTDNVLRSPVMYRVDDRQLLAALRETERNGQDIIGFYHSHTASEAYPSPTDRRQAMAAWPDVIYVIVSLRDERQPVLRAYRINERGEIAEEPVQVEG